MAHILYRRHWDSLLSVEEAQRPPILDSYMPNTKHLGHPML